MSGIGVQEHGAQLTVANEGRPLAECA
jgi:hypothetical protein